MQDENIYLYPDTVPKNRLMFWRKSKEINLKYFEWTIKQLLKSAFVWCEDYADHGSCYPPVQKLINSS